ncbi:hypothetical protein [Thermoproteus tenax]|nr:hypothetical protein [Thermoproteus tenax]
MICSNDMCIEVILVSSEPLTKEILASLGSGALAIAVRPEAVRDWRYLLQALVYAYALKGPARDSRISALMYLTQQDSIESAVATTSPLGLSEYVVAVYGKREEVEKALKSLPRGLPYYPERDFDPWLITNFALKRLT